MKLTVFAFLCLLPTTLFAEAVTISNLVRAESDTMIRANLATYGIGLGEIAHESNLYSHKCKG